MRAACFIMIYSIGENRSVREQCLVVRLRSIRGLRVMCMLQQRKHQVSQKRYNGIFCLYL